MGEIIKKLSTLTFHGEEVDVELNKPHNKGDNDLIHIQSKTLRLDMDKREFVKLGLSILKAEKRLLQYKDIAK